MASTILPVKKNCLRKRILFLCIVICVFIIYNSRNTYLEIPEDCYYREEGDALISAEDLDISFESNSIFFHETSCRGGLTPRQACAIESAAKSHHNRQIYVLFSAPVSEQSLQEGCLFKLSVLKNVKFARIFITKYAKNTPLENIFASEPLFENKLWLEYTSYLLRYVTLYKWGGLYLDTDMYVVKSLNPLGHNWVAKEDNVTVIGAAIAASMDNIGRKFINTLLTEVNDTSIPLPSKSELLIHSGSDAFTRTLQKICSTNDSTEWSAKTCNGFEIYNSQYIYPIHYVLNEVYFKTNHLFEDITRHAYTHHIWDKYTRDKIIEPSSPLAELTPTLCPVVHHMYSTIFGGNLKLKPTEYILNNDMIHTQIIS